MKARIVIVAFEVFTDKSIRELRDCSNVTLNGKPVHGVERPKVNVIKASKSKAKA
jgi:hypothetical protein